MISRLCSRRLVRLAGSALAIALMSGASFGGSYSLTQSRTSYTHKLQGGPNVPGSPLNFYSVDVASGYKATVEIAVTKINRVQCDGHSLSAFLNDQQRAIGANNTWTFQLTSSAQIRMEADAWGPQISWREPIYSTGSLGVIILGYVDHYYTSYYSEFTYTITVSYAAIQVAKPANDDFVSARSLTSLSGYTTGTNVGATRQADEPFAADFATDTTTVWWKWQAPSSGNVQFDTIGSSFDTQMGIYVGDSLSTLEQVAKNDDSAGNGTASKCAFACTAETVYYVCVGGYKGATGSIKLNWVLTAPPMPPDNITVTTNLTSGVSIRWPSVPSAVGYVIARIDDDLNEESGVIFETTGISYLDDTAEPGRTYLYSVVAYNEAGVSDVGNYAYGIRAVALTVLPEEILSVAEGTNVHAVVSTTANWIGTSSDAWISVSPESGSSNGCLNVIVAANPSVYARSGVVTFMADGGDGPDPVAVVPVEQRGVPIIVTFSGNGGSPDVQTGSYSAGEPYGTFPEPPVRTGYVFDGWYSAETRIETTARVPAENLTLEARWSPVGYSVAFHSEHLGIGSGSMAEQPMAYDSGTNLNACAYSRLGYQFVGWAEEADGDPVYADGAGVLNLATSSGVRIDLYAVWEAVELAHTATVAGVTAAVRWPWSGKIDVDYMLECDASNAMAYVDLSARDEDRQRNLLPVTLTGDGGRKAIHAGVRRLTWDVAADYPGFDTSALMVDIVPCVVSLSHVEDIVVSQSVAAVGIELSWPETADARAYEVWRTSTDGGGTPRLLATVADLAYVDAGVTDGQAYRYWVRPVGDLGVADMGDGIACRCDVTVSFDGNGGTVATTSLRYAATRPYGTFPAANRLGYLLSGWTTDSDGTNRIDDSSLVPTNDVRLYAQWTPVTYTIAFDANGEDGDMEPMILHYDETATLPSNSFVSADLDFAGWALSSTGGCVYADRAEVRNLASSESDTVVLYARWAPRAPLNVAASSGTSTEGIEITWDPSPAAASYIVYRSMTDSYSARTKIAETQTCSYLDTAPRMCESATYWIVAVTDGAVKLYSKVSSGAKGKKKAVVDSYYVSKCYVRTDNLLYPWDEVILSPTVRYRDGSTAIVTASWSYNSRYASVIWVDAGSWHPEGYRYLAQGSATWTSSEVSRGYISATVTATSYVDGVSYTATLYLTILYHEDPW